MTLTDLGRACFGFLVWGWVPYAAAVALNSGSSKSGLSQEELEALGALIWLLLAPIGGSGSAMLLAPMSAPPHGRGKRYCAAALLWLVLPAVSGLLLWRLGLAWWRTTPHPGSPAISRGSVGPRGHLRAHRGRSDG
jgi:hypothetical protein